MRRLGRVDLAQPATVWMHTLSLNACQGLYAAITLSGARVDGRAGFQQDH